MGLLGIVIIYSASLGLMFSAHPHFPYFYYGQKELDARRSYPYTGIAYLLYVILGILYFCLVMIFMMVQGWEKAQF